MVWRPIAASVTHRSLVVRGMYGVLPQSSIVGQPVTVKNETAGYLYI